MKYEYNAINNPQFLGDRLLNKLGEDGWELVSHAYNSNNCDHFYTFKREKIAYPKGIASTLTAYQGEDPVPLYDGKTGEQINKKK
jgi:hypothetical protein